MTTSKLVVNNNNKEQKPYNQAYRETIKFLYTYMCYNYKQKDLEPFDVSVAQFAYKFGLQKYLIGCVKVWEKNCSDIIPDHTCKQYLKHSFKLQFDAINIFFWKIYRIPVFTIKDRTGKKCFTTENSLAMRNHALEQCKQRIWMLHKRYKKLKQFNEFKTYLETSKLGTYFRNMQRAGLKIQIAKGSSF